MHINQTAPKGTIAASADTQSLQINTQQTDQSKKIAHEITELGLPVDLLNAAAVVASGGNNMDAAKASGYDQDSIRVYRSTNETFQTAVNKFRSLISCKFLELGGIIAERAKKEIEAGSASSALGFSKLVTETMGEFRSQQIEEVKATSTLKSVGFFDDDEQDG